MVSVLAEEKLMEEINDSICIKSAETDGSFDNLLCDG